MDSTNASKHENTDFLTPLAANVDYSNSKNLPSDQKVPRQQSQDDSSLDVSQSGEKRPKTPKLTDAENVERLIKTIRYLGSTSDFLCEEVKEDILFLNKRFSNETRNENRVINLHGIEAGLTELCLKIVKDLFERDFLEDKLIWFRLKRILVVFWNGSDRYTEICERLLKSDAHAYLLGVIEQPKLVDTNVENLQIYPRKIYTMKAVLGIIHNMLAKLGETGRIAFREKKAVDILQQHLENKNTMIKVKAFINLAYLINEEENEVINADDKNIKYIVDMLKEAVNSENKRSPKGFAAMETIEALNKLAVNDNNKKRIYNSRALESYEKLLAEVVTEEEQATIINGIWTLCFHQEVRTAIIENNASLISSLTGYRVSENKKVQRAAKGVFWLLGEQHSQKKQVTAGYGKHIMISYNWDVKPEALMIRDQLNAAGFKTWMDVDNMTGSTLEAMADGIEKAQVVLVCMTRAYKESPSCRTEAEYTYMQRKSFIPLRLEKGYLADGWLGIMMGAKLWFDFAKNFQGAITGLLQELKGIERGTKREEVEVGICNVSGQPVPPSSLRERIPSHIGLLQPPFTQVPSLDSALVRQNTPGLFRTATRWDGSNPKGPAYSTWSGTKVTEWFKQIGLGHRTKLLDLDGALLQEWAEMRQDAPEFFYRSLRDDLRFPLVDILKFTYALRKL